MIKSKSREGWFGGSDTSFIVGNWETKTFKKWWLEKLGIRVNDFENIAMKRGTYYEHKILETIPGINMDRQLLIPELKLRVNLDGDTTDTIYEVKTYKDDKEFKVSKQYWRQAQVEMFADRYFGNERELKILAYPLGEKEYSNIFTEIDPSKRQFFSIEYDEKFIEEYLLKLAHLKDCLEKGIMPSGINNSTR